LSLDFDAQLNSPSPQLTPCIHTFWVPGRSFPQLRLKRGNP
jgi:hypothetical protein